MPLVESFSGIRGVYDDGLDTFIQGQPIPGGNGERDGNGVSDIKLFFQTYAYSGS